jgi:hypothetical protein
MLGVAAATLIAVAIAGGLGDAGSLAGAGFLSVIGLGMFGVGALRLPGWARLRRRQMEGVAARLALAAESQPPDNLPVE